MHAETAPRASSKEGKTGTDLNGVLLYCVRDMADGVQAMRGKEYELDGDELVQALQDVRDHVTGRRKITMRTTQISLPRRVTSMQPAEVREIRRKLKMSQAVFARLLNVPVVTEASWETGRRSPSGAALRLLQIARKESLESRITGDTPVVTSTRQILSFLEEMASFRAWGQTLQDRDTRVTISDSYQIGENGVFWPWGQTPAGWRG